MYPGLFGGVAAPRPPWTASRRSKSLELPVEIRCPSWAEALAEKRDQQLEQAYRLLYAQLVGRVTWRFRLSAADAEDIVQDAFAIALVKLDPSTNPRAWLVQVVDYLSLNACRKARRREKLLCRWRLDESCVTGRRDPSDADETFTIG